MDERSAHLRRIFRHLKVGVFPPEAVDAFTVGRGRELNYIETRLDIVANGATSHVFLEGDYGSGKSHALKAVESIAFRKRFAVSWITLDGQAHSCNHPARYFHTLLENLRIQGVPVRGLAAIVRHWLRSEQATSLVSWAEQSNSWLRYPINRLNGNADDIDAVPYLNSIIETRDIIPKNGRLGIQPVSERMDSLSAMLKALGYSGAVYLFDELETVATLLGNIRQRYLSYEFLNALVDGRRHSNCFYAFAVTPDFGERIKNDRIYRDVYALEYADGCRFAQKWVDRTLDILALKPITRKDRRDLCQLLLRYHQEAYNWITDRELVEALFQKLDLCLDRRHMNLREIVCSFVHALDVCEQYQDKNPFL